MANIFNSVQIPKVSSNTFDLSYDMKLSLNMGDLVPVHCQEIVPGDKIHMSTESMLRFAPLIAPIMHKVDVYTHFFFVPNRLSWSGWEDFITGNTGVAAPYIETVFSGVGSLADYLGLPHTTAGPIDKVNALPFAAYQRVYNEYYRDQNLIPEVPCDLRDGAQVLPGTSDNPLMDMRKRAWQHDYFTSALPSPQAGEPVLIPSHFSEVKVGGTGALPPNDKMITEDGSPIGTGPLSIEQSNGSNNGYIIGPNGDRLIMSPSTLIADLWDTNLENGTVNELRRAIKLQEWLEKTARGGKRYIEQIMSHFGVKSSDARLNRPEYLGGSKQPMVISEVLQTSTPSAEGPTPQGNMAGHGISVGDGKSFSYHAEEHGYIIGIMSVMPKTAYQQGIPRHFSKFDYLEYYWPSFAHLGEQEIKNRELFYKFSVDPLEMADNDKVFGYTPRYAEYKYSDSRVAGDFRDTLSYWHMSRIFENRPGLSQEFVECDPTKRVFAVIEEEGHSVYAHVFHRIKAQRKMPTFGTPMI